ncbi:MAG: hypothetical protein JWM49_2120 [Microbacteriaceae bacterium]|nr:hypothetical protein [Microbacteriaceae bacterium]
MTAEFPKAPLEQVLALPQAIVRAGGQPLDKIDMAAALDISPGSSTLRTLGAASSSYGLTGGSFNSRFTMAPLGESITSPKSSDEASEAMVTAALTPPLFKKIFDAYKGKKYPELQFMLNTLKRDFKVTDRQADSCADIFTSNMKLVGLLRQTKGGLWLTETPVVDNGAPADESADESDDVDNSDEAPLIAPAGTPADSGLPAEPIKRRRPNKLFIGHGRNKAPLQQLTKTLSDLKIPYVVAEDEATSGRPISQKVRDTMEQCGAAILIFSADIEYFDKDQDSVWRPSENVSHELGAASVMYDNRVILFKEESIDLASNYSGIGYIPFEKDKLDAKTNELLRELIGLRILRVSVDDTE